MERKQFFILEKDFLNTREVGDLIEALGPGGVGAYMAILIYLRHQPAYTTCYRPSLLSQLVRCNNGTVELFRDVLLNFGLSDYLYNNQKLRFDSLSSVVSKNRLFCLFHQHF